MTTPVAITHHAAMRGHVEPRDGRIVASTGSRP